MSEEENQTEMEAPEASLLQFLSGMGAQTLMHLGQMASPMTGEVQLDLPNAKYSIDLLSILEEKTKGNLNEEENEYLTTMMTQLRLSYVTAVENESGIKIRPGDEATAEAIAEQAGDE